MKKILKEILEFILKILAIIILKKHRPEVIAITGSCGKTTTKDMVYHVLKHRFSVRKNKANFNNEIGIPLTILGLENISNPRIWLKKLPFAFLKTLFSRYPKILVLEMGADKLGDIRYLTSFIKPKIAIITSIGPAHLEFFKTEEAIAFEKGKLVEALDERGFALLNYDDPKVRKMYRRSKGKVIFFGKSSSSNLWASEIKCDLEGISFKIHWQGSIIPFKIPVLGVHQIYAALPAIACGIIYGINLVEIVESLKTFIPPKRRLNLLKGKKESILIDDSYNANPLSVEMALEVLAELGELVKGGKKVAILGDMLELGDFTEEGHRKIAKKAAKICDLIFAVGENMKYMVDELEKINFPKNRIFVYDNSLDVIPEISSRLSKNDLILVKGSRKMRMERIVEAIKEK